MGAAHRPRAWMVAATALLLASATVASRMPFVSHMLYAWDSADFALALRHYDVGLHQPHPPGYPLYVGIAALVNMWLQDANASYVYVGVAASAAAVGTLFLLASRMYGIWVGLASAILLGASVGFWGYGEVAYPYTCTAFAGTLLAWLCYLMWEDHRSLAVLSGLVLGIASGVQQDTLIFIGPLWLVSVWRAGILRLFLSTVVLCLAVVSWLLPAVQLSGGWDAFQQASSAESSNILFTYSVPYTGLPGLRHNTETIILFLRQTFGLSALVTIYAMGRFLTFKALVSDRRLPFLLLWFLPPALVYATVHVGDPGCVLPLLPPLCIVTAVGIRDIAGDFRSALLLMSGRHQRLSGLARSASAAGSALAVLLVMGLVVWNAIAFLLTPGPAHLAEIRSIDSILLNQVEYARSLRPESVIVLARARFRQFEYYLPEYNVQLLYDERQQGYIEARRSYQIPDGVSTVLVMDFGRPPSSFPGATGGEVALVNSPQQNVSVWQFDVRAGETIHYGYDYFAVDGRG